MSVPTLVHRTPAGVLLLSLALTACGPSEEDIQKLVDARVGALQQRLEAEKVIKTDAELEKQKAEDAAKTEWEKSLDVLAALDKLMEDYKPTLPDATDNTDLLRCTTDDDLASNAALAGAAKGLAQQKAASEQARRAATAAFEKGKWLQFRVDNGWITRIATTTRDAGCMLNDGRGAVVMGEATNDLWDKVPGANIVAAALECRQSDMYQAGMVRWQAPASLDAWGNEAYDAVGQSLYSRTTEPAAPELMKRIEASKFDVPARFSCRVDQVTRATGGARTVNCSGSGDSAGAYIKLSASDTAPAYHIGDVVSVPLKDTKRDPSGVLFKEVWDRTDHWVVSADPASVTIDVPATCPTIDEIVAATAAK
jgi:hypothetical protein